MTILEKLHITDRQERVLFCRASAKAVFMEKSIALNAYTGKVEGLKLMIFALSLSETRRKTVRKNLCTFCSILQ